MNILKCISPIQLFFIAVVISLVFVVEFEDKELDVLGNLFIAIGGLLVVVASQGDFLEGLKSANRREELYDRQISLLEEKRDYLKRRL